MNADNSITPSITSLPASNLDMMEILAKDEQSLSDIKNLTSSRVTDQLKVFLVAQARNELTRVIKLTKFLDKLESNYINKVDQAMDNNEFTLRQYADSISLITDLLARSNDIVYKVLKDDSLMTILNTTIYSTNSEVKSTSVIASLKDAPSRERVRNVIQSIIDGSIEAYQNQKDPNVIEVNSSE